MSLKKETDFVYEIVYYPIDFIDIFRKELTALLPTPTIYAPQRGGRILTLSVQELELVNELQNRPLLREEK